MADARFDYWDECIASSFEEHGISATSDQIKCVAGDVKASHENYGMAFYQPPAGDHYKSQIAELQRALKTEREKVHCKRCNGNGTITVYFGTMQSTSSCDKCNGEGRHSP